ncbi:uncharacterized protein TM35_000401890 [Trypanosoma theileri]|uniref:Transmembrane protein n=1 Tax=Trypanosoma theileri TaxID=67003 RepID=A0A1X0NJJ2_9TRYP|nr:uncharacterized protein TM35_000401890 [Trypanosoma theileri]ORC84922.1 hypothetical protein TM35_000401890 [Trypanosoma theileri]
MALSTCCRNALVSVSVIILLGGGATMFVFGILYAFMGRIESDDDRKVAASNRTTGIILLVFGVVAIVASIVILCRCCCCRRNRQIQEEDEEERMNEGTTPRSTEATLPAVPLNDGKVLV